MKLLTLFAGLLALSFGASAQDAGWPVVERCVGEFTYPSVPPARWDFEGTLVSLNDDGVRAIQAAEPQQYFIALSAVETFPQIGAFSPDGTHFVYPAIDGRETVLMVVPVGVDGETVEIAWPFDTTVAVEALPRPIWFSSAVIHVQSNLDGEWYAIDRTEPESITRIETPIAADSAISTGAPVAYSPDGRYAAYIGIDARGGVDTVRYADLESGTVYDLCFRLESSPFPVMAWSPDSSTLAFTVDGFPVLLHVDTLANEVLRYETGQIMAWLPPPPVFKDGRG